MNSNTSMPSWAKPVLQAAGIYNIAWGAAAILFPTAIFRWAGMEIPNYPELWQCIGMIVGVYGIGYWIAAYDPQRHWPIVLVGLLGKVFGPVGFAQAVISGRFPPKMGLTILTNDLIWWVPFSIILWVTWKTARDNSASETAAPRSPKQADPQTSRVGAP